MHKNNFDFLRLLFALFVIVTHSYSLSGIPENDLLNQITNGQASLSYIGVRGFFVISGYLIFQSMERSKSLRNYFKKRFLRLFPALIIVLCLTIILGFFVYNSSFSDYISNSQVWTYLLNNLTLYNLQFGIDGVLDNKAINGSLWTIRYEFSFYIIISLFFLIRNRKKIVLYLLIVIYLFLLVGKIKLFHYLGSPGVHIQNSMTLNLALFFIAGSLLSSIKRNYLTGNYWHIYLSFYLMIASFYFEIFDTLQFIIFPVLVISFGLHSTRYINEISSRIGDISYGIYIYSFPVQQTLIYFFMLNQLNLLIYCLPISILFGLLSWHLVEKKALRYKS